MAYNNKDEVVTVLKDIEKNARGEVIRVSKIENSGNVSYDIRNMYRKDDGELGFTSKGIRLTEDMMKEILDVLNKNMK